GLRTQRACFRLGAKGTASAVRKRATCYCRQCVRMYSHACSRVQPWRSALAMINPPEFVERRIAVPDLPHGVAAELSAVEVGEPLVNGSHVFLPSTFPCPAPASTRRTGRSKLRMRTMSAGL